MDIKEMAFAGYSAKKIAQEKEMPLSTLYLHLKKSGIRINHKTKYDSEIRKYREQDLSYPEIAKPTGASRHTIRQRCIALNLEYGKNDVRRLDNFDFESKIKEKGFAYISGYKNHRSFVKVRCQNCGTIQERSFEALISHETARCYFCRKQEQEKIRATKEAEKTRSKTEAQKQKEAEKRKKKENKTIDAINNGVQSKLKICPVCNAIYYKDSKYCSKLCKKRRHNKHHETRRRVKTKRALVDKDITIQRLYARDNGRCYLCGKMCDWNDYKDIDGTIVAGDNYPSIDHVMPLASGGQHAWRNVKLACRRCNYLKSDNIPPA